MKMSRTGCDGGSVLYAGDSRGERATQNSTIARKKEKELLMRELIFIVLPPFGEFQGSVLSRFQVCIIISILH